MMINCRSTLLFIGLFSCFAIPASAADSLGSAINNQNNIDKGIKQQNAIKGRDVYSKLQDSTVGTLVLPQETNCFTVKQLIVDNADIPNYLVNKISQYIVGRCLGVNGVENVATYLQDFLIKKGYVTSRVEIPNQKLKNGTLKLVVRAGRIGKIIINNYKLNKKVLAIKEGDILNLRAIEQSLEIMQRNPSVDVKFSIAPGQTEGTSDIIINVLTYKNVAARLWVNNWGDKPTGPILTNAIGYLYNPTHLNDLFYFAGTTSIHQNHGSYDNMSAYYSVPFGYWNFDFNWVHSVSKQQIAIDNYYFDYKGESQYLSAKANRMIFRDQNKKISLNVSLIKRTVKYHLEDIELLLQRRDMTNIKTGINYKQEFADGELNSNLSWQRFLPILDADYTSDMNSGLVSKRSNIFSLDTSYSKILNIGSVRGWYELSSNIQYAPKPLTLQDQFSLGDRWNVRGFENSNSLNGDKGFYLQNTYNVVTGFKDIIWYAGLDYGQIWGNIYPIGYYSNGRLMGAATGFKGALGKFGYDLSVSTPLMYPEHMITNSALFSFNVYLQI